MSSNHFNVGSSVGSGSKPPHSGGQGNLKAKAAGLPLGPNQTTGYGIN